MTQDRLQIQWEQKCELWINVEKRKAVKYLWLQNDIINIFKAFYKLK